MGQLRPSSSSSLTLPTVPATTAGVHAAAAAATATARGTVWGHEAASSSCYWCAGLLPPLGPGPGKLIGHFCAVV